MPAPGRLVLLLLLAPACFHDTPPELIATSGGTDATSTSTDATSSETSEPVTSTGEPNSSTSTGTSTSPSSTSTTTSTSETGCTETSWYLDLDMDGHGDPNTLMLACVSPTGHVELGDDCDDGDGARAGSSGALRRQGQRLRPAGRRVLGGEHELQQLRAQGDPLEQLRILR